MGFIMTFHMSTVHFDHFQVSIIISFIPPIVPLPLPLCPPPTFQHYVYHNPFLLQVYIIKIYKFNLLNPFSVAHRYVFMDTTWVWIVTHEAYPWARLTSCLSAAIICL